MTIAMFGTFKKINMNMRKKPHISKSEITNSLYAIFPAKVDITPKSKENYYCSHNESFLFIFRQPSDHG